MFFLFLSCFYSIWTDSLAILCLFVSQGFRFFVFSTKWSGVERCALRCSQHSPAAGSLLIPTARPSSCVSHSSAFKMEEGDAPIKRCPKCSVYIERDEGCAQMMCKNCKHAFCWYCLESLDVSTGQPPTAAMSS